MVRVIYVYVWVNVYGVGPRHERSHNTDDDGWKGGR